MSEPTFCFKALLSQMLLFRVELQMAQFVLTEDRNHRRFELFLAGCSVFAAQPELAA